jgi:hypothetical protein
MSDVCEIAESIVLGDPIVIPPGLADVHSPGYWLAGVPRPRLPKCRLVVRIRIKEEFYEIGLPRIRAVSRWFTQTAIMVAGGCAIAVSICGLIRR